MEKLIDLHMHSIYSDGELTPDELINECIKKNIKTISITDHDNIGAYKNISSHFLNDKRINIIPGIELKTKTDKGTMHILGYYIDVNNKELNNKIKELKNNSIYHIISLLHQIKKDYNIVFETEDIQKLICKIGNIGRPDIAKLCIKYGYVNSVKEAFDKYLIEAYEKIRNNSDSLSYKECIDLITHASGLPVLAHPNTLKKDDKELLELLKNMKKCGLKGIEVYHSSYTEEEKRKYLKMAKDLDLLVSGGSDYHGKTVKPEIELGTGKNNNLKIKKLSILD